MFLEIAIVLVLTLLNGLLAMSELAIVSSRLVRLRVLADRGSRGAERAITRPSISGSAGRSISRPADLRIFAPCRVTNDGQKPSMQE